MIPLIVNFSSKHKLMRMMSRMVMEMIRWWWMKLSMVYSIMKMLGWILEIVIIFFRINKGII